MDNLVAAKIEALTERVARLEMRTDQLKERVCFLEAVSTDIEMADIRRGERLLALESWAEEACNTHPDLPIFSGPCKEEP
jgi:hypothetical protein